MFYQVKLMICVCIVAMIFNLCYSLDIDECAKNQSLCSGGTCINTPDSFRCECPPGHELTSDGKDCKAGGIKGALNDVVKEFKSIEDETANAMKYVTNVVVDEFKIIEEKASDASNVIVDEFHLIGAETSNAIKHAADAVVYEFQQIQAKSYGCHCADYSCGCCAHLEFPKIHLNDTGCVNITYLAKDYGISFTMTIDNLTIYNETISAHNPPPICFGAPYLEKYAELCVHFYDLDATKTKLHGCVDIEARLHKVVVGRYKVGCFNIGKSTLGLWKKYHRLLIEKIRAEQKKLPDNSQ